MTDLNPRNISQNLIVWQNKIAEIKFAKPIIITIFTYHFSICTSDISKRKISFLPERTKRVQTFRGEKYLNLFSSANVYRIP